MAFYYRYKQKVWQIKFFRIYADFQSSSGKIQRIPHQTHCQIFVERGDGKWIQYSAGSAIHHLRDLSYESARKLALRRALKPELFPKQLRKAVIWPAYFGRIKKKEKLINPLVQAYKEVEDERTKE